jgi:hypothetical protein
MPELRGARKRLRRGRAVFSRAGKPLRAAGGAAAAGAQPSAEFYFSEKRRRLSISCMYTVYHGKICRKQAMTVCSRLMQFGVALVPATP